MPDHGIEGNILRGLRQPEDLARILAGNEPLGNNYKEISGEHYEKKRHRHCNEAMPQDLFQRPVVRAEQTIEEALRSHVKPAVFLLVAQEAAAEHGREAQRYEA